jgi:hypothetical protein
MKSVILATAGIQQRGLNAHKNLHSRVRGNDGFCAGPVVMEKLVKMGSSLYRTGASSYQNGSYSQPAKRFSAATNTFENRQTPAGSASGRRSLSQRLRWRCGNAVKNSSGW